MTYIPNKALERILRLHEANKKPPFAKEKDDPKDAQASDDQDTGDEDTKKKPPFGAKKAPDDDGGNDDAGNKKQPPGGDKKADAEKIDKKQLKRDVTLTKQDKADLDKVPSDGKTLTGEKANKIEISPVLEGTVVYTFGRMNPPTIGHQKLVEKVMELAEQNDAVARVYLSKTVDSNRNPIDPEKKLAYAIKAFGDVVQQFPEEVKNDIFGVSRYLGERYEHAILVVGSDRVRELQEKMLKYVGTEALPFKSLQIVSAGDRDPDAADAAGASASALRESARAGDMKAFAAGLPATLKSVAPLLYQDVRLEEGIAAPVLTEENLADVIDVAEARREEPYEFSHKEMRSLQEKANTHRVPVEILQHVFRRGVANWIQEDVDHLTHQQFAFNRVNSFLAGGAAVELDRDLAEQALMSLITPPAHEAPRARTVVEAAPMKPSRVSARKLIKQVNESRKLVEAYNRNDPSESGYHHGFHDKYMSEMDLMAKFPSKAQQRAWHEAHRRGTVDRVSGKK